jgi:hypothetical protein
MCGILINQLYFENGLNWLSLIEIFKVHLLNDVTK